MAAREPEALAGPTPPGWPPAWWLALADASLERKGGAAIFGRGRAYAADGSVELLAEDPWPEPAVRARVVGTDVYETELWFDGDSLTGECDCPHALDGWFCKHQVAVALVWRERSRQGASVGIQPGTDSNGEIGEVCDSIGAELVRALRSAGARPVDFGDAYLELQLDAPFDCFDAVAVEAAMGATALARYRQLVQQRWRSVKDAALARKAERAAAVSARKHRSPLHEERAEPRLSTLEALHLAQLARMGADEAMLAVLREDLSDAWAHHRVIEFLDGTPRRSHSFAGSSRNGQAWSAITGR